MKKISLILVMIFAMLVSCTDGPKMDNGLIERKDIVLSKSGEELTKATNEFAVNFFKAVNERNKDNNVVVSPLSVSEVLAMISNGAEDETYEQIVKAMGLEGYEIDEVNEYFKTLQAGLLSVDPSCKLVLSNSLWLNTVPYAGVYETKYKQDFLDVNKEYYGAELREENFSDDAIYAKINDWCSKSTDGIITNYVDKDTHNISDALAAQINATLFKGGWSVALNPQGTQPSQFINYKNEKESVDLMCCNGINAPALGRYYCVEEDMALTEALEMPFGNKAFSMLFVMPPAEVNINEFVESLTPEFIAKVMPERIEYTELYGNIYIPKFKTSTKVTITESLRALGIDRLFTPVAQLDKMVNKSNEFYVARADQETSFEIDEQGAKVATVTSAEEMIGSDQKSFNRPFVYMIRECSTGAILFIGKYEKVK